MRTEENKILFSSATIVSSLYKKQVLNARLY